MKTIFKLGLSVLIIMLLTSCDSEDISLQKYYVESESNTNYLMLDIPTSIISLEENASEKAKQAYESIDKVNVLAFKLDGANQENYLIEKAKVKKILKNKNYSELMQINNGGSKIIVKYLGTENAIDEVIVFASDKEKGFALARVLGDEMNPENLTELFDNIKDLDKSSDIFKKMDDFFGND